jgi:hypothetical protein
VFNLSGAIAILIAAPPFGLIGFNCFKLFDSSTYLDFKVGPEVVHNADELCLSNLSKLGRYPRIAKERQAALIEQFH